MQHLAVLEQRQLAGAPAQVQVERGSGPGSGHGHRPRPVGGQDGLQAVPCGGADEPAALGREELGDGPRVGALQGHAGQDHGPGVDGGPGQAGLPVGSADEDAEGADVDQPVGAVGGEEDRRAVDRLPLDHHEAAGQRLRQALQVEA